VPLIGLKAGRRFVHLACTSGQRVRNTQPLGGLIGESKLPCNIISKKMDQALALAKKELRMEAFRDMDIHLQQELILLPLYHHQHQMHHAERVQGHQLNGLGWVNFKDIWFDDGCSDH
jgi:MarR-like DNA-binding transcriptional regulator SgrR of sgrS sRNA